MAFIKYDRNLSIVCFPYQDESGTLFYVISFALSLKSLKSNKN